MEASQFEVFQVIEQGVALANTEKILGEGDYKLSAFNGPLVLLVNDEGKHYLQIILYDDEVIKVPSEKRARQVGVYQYSTKMGYKTVPIVKIME